MSEIERLRGEICRQRVELVQAQRALDVLRRAEMKYFSSPLKFEREFLSKFLPPRDVFTDSLVSQMIYLIVSPIEFRLHVSLFHTRANIK